MYKKYTRARLESVVLLVGQSHVQGRQNEAVRGRPGRHEGVLCKT